MRPITARTYLVGHDSTSGKKDIISGFYVGRRHDNYYYLNFSSTASFPNNKARDWIDGNGK